VNMPGFSAEASLYRTSRSYLKKVAGQPRAHEPIQPALDGNWGFLGCNLHCDEYTRCDQFGCIPPITICTLECWGRSLTFSFS
jgi:hypothetical protein